MDDYYGGFENGKIEWGEEMIEIEWMICMDWNWMKIKRKWSGRKKLIKFFCMICT